MPATPLMDTLPALCGPGLDGQQVLPKLPAVGAPPAIVPSDTGFASGNQITYCDGAASAGSCFDTQGGFDWDVLNSAAFD